LISNRSYLLRALYEWILDSDCTPYIVISTKSADVLIPPGYAEDNQIVLNVSPGAVRNLEISQTSVCLQSRFSGTAHNVSAPVGAITAIFAKETGEGMVFEFEEDTESSEGTAETSVVTVDVDVNGADRSVPGSHLRVVK